jgi:hypothetical protein
MCQRHQRFTSGQGLTPSSATNESTMEAID